MSSSTKKLERKDKGMVIYCTADKCRRKIKDQRLFINGQCLNLCDEHILDFIRKTRTRLSWGNA